MFQKRSVCLYASSLVNVDRINCSDGVFYGVEVKVDTETRNLRIMGVHHLLYVVRTPVKQRPSSVQTVGQRSG